MLSWMLFKCMFETAWQKRLCIQTSFSDIVPFSRWQESQNITLWVLADCTFVPLSCLCRHHSHTLCTTGWQQQWVWRPTASILWWCVVHGVWQVLVTAQHRRRLSIRLWWRVGHWWSSHVCVCVCVWERERDWECVYVYDVCVWGCLCESVSVCVFVCIRVCV